jgi:hypothetical protein
MPCRGAVRVENAVKEWGSSSEALEAAADITRHKG